MSIEIIRKTEMAGQSTAESTQQTKPSGQLSAMGRIDKTQFEGRNLIRLEEENLNNVRCAPCKIKKH